MSKIDYNNIVSHSIPEYLQKRLQRVQVATVSFVLGRYAKKPDLRKLGWPPVVERRESNLLNNDFKALHLSNWPSYLKLDLHIPGRTPRSSNERTLKVPLETGTFQDSASRVFNILPSAARNYETFNVFKGGLGNFWILRSFLKNNVQLTWRNF